jgi:hypothetical protein
MKAVGPPPWEHFASTHEKPSPGNAQLAERDRLESGDPDAIKVALQVHDRKVRLLGLAARVAVRVGPEPPADFEFFEQAVELITAITSVPGGRDELLRGLGHPDMPCSTQSAEWLPRKVIGGTIPSRTAMRRTGRNRVPTARLSRGLISEKLCVTGEYS